MYERGAASIFLAAVFWWDMRKRKIPNRLLAAGGAAGAAFLVADSLAVRDQGRTLELLAVSLGLGILILFIGFWLWAARMIGAAGGGADRLAGKRDGGSRNRAGNDSGGGLVSGKIDSAGKFLRPIDSAVRLHGGMPPGEKAKALRALEAGWGKGGDSPGGLYCLGNLYCRMVSGS